jgi:hypothetical protein
VTLYLAVLAQLALVEGDPERAALLAGAADGLRRRVGLGVWPLLRRGDRLGAAGADDQSGRHQVLDAWTVRGGDPLEQAAGGQLAHAGAVVVHLQPALSPPARPLRPRPSLGTT